MYFGESMPISSTSRFPVTAILCNQTTLTYSVYTSLRVVKVK
jgi:hypothetical protein